jgi:hypothetical protein
MGFGNVTYPGYRKISIVNNQAWNYTYDLNGDGIRDGQVSTPSGRYRVIYSEDIGIGINPTAGIYWILSNYGTDYLPAARAIFTVPQPPVGMHWDLNIQNKTAGAYIRTQISNNTHIWIDARVPVTPLTNMTLRLEPILGSV